MKLAVCFFFLTPALLQATEIRLLDRTGSVYVHLAGTPDEDLVEAPAQSSLDEGDQVITGKYSTARLLMDGQSIIELGPQSDFTIKKLEGPSFDFFLAGGRFLAKIKSLMESKKVMNVRTPVAVAAVRGTELGIIYDDEKGLNDVCVFDEGEVAVESTSTGQTVVLNAGTEATVVRGLGRIQPRPIEKFEGLRANLVALRERRNVAWKEWKAKTLEERAEFRRQLREERAIKRHNIPYARPERSVPKKPLIDRP